MNRFPANIESHQSYLAEDIVTAFASLFRGLPDAWGTITGQCVKEKVTLEHYRRHLYGKVSLGIYPLRRDCQCRWVAVDIDRDDVVQAIALIEQSTTVSRCQAGGSPAFYHNGRRPHELQQTKRSVRG